LQCANNLKQIAIGLYNYADTHPEGLGTTEKAPLFPAGTVPNPVLPPDKRLSWLVEVLPFMEQDDLYGRIDRAAGWDAAAHAPAVQAPLKGLQCPDWGRESAPGPAYLTPYLGVAGVGADAPSLPAGDRKAGVFGYDRRTALADVKDGASNTLLIWESARDNGPWSRGGPATLRGLDPADRPYLGTGRPFGGPHFAENSLFQHGRSIGCNAAMADGSVRFLQEAIGPQVLEALATIADGAEVGDGW
jgi:prepilin-type processing-associated H-X9-DG protein